MMTMLLASVLIGAGLGAAMSRLAKCSTGSCPLTATWKRGAFFGALFGLGVFMATGPNDANAAEAVSENVKPLSASDFDAQVTKATAPVVVDFYATWCGPCKRLSPMLDSMAGSLTNKVKFFKVDVDQSAALVQQYQIEGMPTLIFFKNGKVVDRILGLPDKEALQSRLNAFAQP
jgi:thioredoxin 1